MGVGPPEREVVRGRTTSKTKGRVNSCQQLATLPPSSLPPQQSANSCVSKFILSSEAFQQMKSYSVTQDIQQTKAKRGDKEGAAYRPCSWAPPLKKPQGASEEPRAPGTILKVLS